MAKTNAQTTTKTPPTKKELREYYERNLERLAAARRADDLKSELEPMRNRLFEYVKAHGGADRTTKRQGFVLAIETGNRFPNWKEKFIALTSAEKAEEERLNTPPSEYVTVKTAEAA